MKRMMHAACVMVAALAATGFADWPRFMGPSGDGIAPASEKINKQALAEMPKEIWSLPMATGFGSPAITGGKVYLLDRPGGGAKEVFSVLDASTGKIEWSVENESTPFRDNYGTTRGTPAIDGDMAYTIGITGDVLGIDLPNKKIAWKKNIGADFGARPGGWGFAMSPVVHGDLLLVDTPGSKESGIVALDKKTGEKKWTSKAFGGSDTYTTPIVVTIDGVEQAVGWHRGAVASVAIADGTLLWKYDWKTNRPIPNPVYLGDGRFFLTIGYGGGSAIIDVKKSDAGFAATEVMKDAAGSKTSNAIFYKGCLYTNASDQGAGLQCRTPEGKVTWESKQKFGLGSMIIVDDTILIINGDNGTLFFVEASPEGYKELGRAKVLATKDVWAPLALCDGKLLVRDQKTLKCFDIGSK